MQLLFWSSVYVVEVVQKYCYDTEKSIHGMYIILGYRWTAGFKNDFSTALFQIVPKTVLWTIKTQSKLPIDNLWLYQTWKESMFYL